MKLKAYAKINLTLDVTGKRADGFHTLDTVMQSVSLYDRVELHLSRKPGIRARCDKPYIPTDIRNSAVKAARLFLDEAGQKEVGVELSLHKKIPSRGGMGGGSADAAAVLFGLQRLLGEPLTQERLMVLAVQVGADVPFCLIGGTRRCTGIGEGIAPAPPMPPCALVICKPPVGMSTPRAYAQLDSMPPAHTRATPRMMEALESGNLALVAKQLYNRFDETQKLMRVREVKTAILSAGALGALMTGSGSAVFGVFESMERAKACGRLLEGKGEVFVVQPMPQGVEMV